MPLTDFRSPTGNLVREPHNSYISVWGRLGFTGAAAWLLMQITLYHAWWRSYRLTKKFGWIHAQNNLILLLIFMFFIILAALGEDAMEKPYGAIPYYLFFGVVLRYGMLLREHAELRH
jgi:O-antigen ligase